jgi:hypothetical protein
VTGTMPPDAGGPFAYCPSNSAVKRPPFRRHRPHSPSSSRSPSPDKHTAAHTDVAAAVEAVAAAPAPASRVPAGGDTAAGVRAVTEPVTQSLAHGGAGASEQSAEGHVSVSAEGKGRVSRSGGGGGGLLPFVVCGGGQRGGSGSMVAGRGGGGRHASVSASPARGRIGVFARSLSPVERRLDCHTFRAVEHKVCSYHSMSSLYVLSTPSSYLSISLSLQNGLCMFVSMYPCIYKIKGPEHKRVYLSAIYVLSMCMYRCKGRSTKASIYVLGSSVYASTYVCMYMCMYRCKYVYVYV